MYTYQKITECILYLYLTTLFYLLQILELSSPWYKLLGAVLRGVAVNRNDIIFVLTGESHHLSKDDLVSQLSQEKAKRFEVVERVWHIHFISHPLDSTCELCVLMHYSL